MAKPRSRKPRSRGTVADGPLHPDDLVAREAARQAEAPARTGVKSLQRGGLIVSALGKTAAGAGLRPARDVPGGYVGDPDARLISGAVGRTSGRLPLKAASGRGASSTSAKRPRGVEHSYLPRIAPRWTRPMLRSPSGGLVQPEKVYGSDDRTTFWPSGYPWHCAGRIFTWTDPSATSWAWSGSGVLVGPRHVLTAGHVCPWGANPWMMLFVPGYYDGQPVPNVNSYVSDYRGWDTDEQVTAWDMAILRLYDPLGDQLGFFGSKLYSSSWQGQSVWSLIGWPQSIGNAQRPTWQGSIPTIDDDPDGNAVEIEHQGDSTPGNSGGPFYAFWPDNFPYVIGAHSGAQVTSDEDNNVAAGGQAMVDLIIWGHQNWP